MKRKFLLHAVIFLMLSWCAFGQAGVNPCDEFYEMATTWFIKGYAERLPQLKPYPLSTIEKILTDVIECDDKDESERAAALYERIFGRKFHASLSGDVRARIYSIQDTIGNGVKVFDDYELYSGLLSLAGDVPFNEYAGASYLLSFRAQNDVRAISELFPLYAMDNRFDGIKDLTFDAGNADFLLDLNAVTSFGTERLNGSVGFNRLGYGIFSRSDMMLNPSANPLANLTFNAVDPHFEYSQVCSLPTAQNQTLDDDYAWCKGMFFHSFRVPVFNRRLTVSYFESVVFGGGFQPAYLMPVPWAIITNVSGSTENIIAGLNFLVKPVPFFAWSTDLLFDDFKLKDFIKLKWNDAALRAGVKTGFIYTPQDSVCSLVTFDYTLLSAYTYTTYDTQNSSYNYTDYTNYGKNMGTELLPNSQQIEMTMHFNPFSWLVVTSRTRYMHHANPYESLEDEEVLELSGKTATDGSWKQNTQNLETAVDAMNLLTQKNDMLVLQASLDFDVRLSARKGSGALINLGYTFEYIKNDGVDKSLFPGHYETVDEVAAARKEWEAFLHNSYNHFFKAGVTLQF